MHVLIPDSLDILGRRQVTVDKVCIQTDILADLQQDRSLADIQSSQKIGAEEIFRNGILTIMQASESD